jgi:hypothetical protein
VVLSGSLWWGPGGGRLRSPINRVVVPVARSGGLWVAAVVVLLATGAALAVVAMERDVAWWPDHDQPLRDVNL